VLIRSLGTSLMLLASIGLGPAYGGTFECTCGNSTKCRISCTCSGSASCGHDECSGSCAACPQTGVANVANTLAASIFRNSFIVTRGRFSEQDLLRTMDTLLSTDQVRVVRQMTPTGEYASVGAQVGELDQVIHLPAVFFDDRAVKSDMLNVVRQQLREILERPELRRDYLQQFFH
jgi:hypothetical protein